MLITLGLITALALFVLVWLPGVGLLARSGQSRERRHRALVEDALKYLHAAELRGAPATPESLAGHLRLRVAATLDLVAEMEARGLIRTTGAGLALTSSGQEIAVRVIRAHRLLERYLADELQMPLEAIDIAADRREHTVTPEDATALEARSDSCVRPPTGEHRRGRDRRLMVDRKVG